MINKPIFTCGAESATIEHPSTSERITTTLRNTTQTLRGNAYDDLLHSKFIYNLSWEALKKVEYDDLLAVYEEHLISGIGVTFTYDKWSTSSSGVLCLMEISESNTIGEGSSGYYLGVTLTLTPLVSSLVGEYSG